MKRWTAIVGVMLVVLVGRPGAADAKAAPVTCGPLSGSVRLTADLTCTSSIEVQGPTDLNLDGHTLTARIWGGESSITIRNGTVDGAVLLGAPFAPTTDRLRHVHITGLVDVEGQVGLIRNSQLDAGVILDGQTDLLANSTVIGPVTSDDADFGGSRVIKQNTITGSIAIYDEFPLVDVTGQITDNTVTGSTSNGIYVGGGDEYGFLIARNTVSSSAGDGIQVGSRYPKPGNRVTLTRNVTIDNAGHGINVLPTSDIVIDGGHNLASGNGTEPQCVGVICLP